MHIHCTLLLIVIGDTPQISSFHAAMPLEYQIWVQIQLNSPHTGPPRLQPAAFALRELLRALSGPSTPAAKRTKERHPGKQVRKEIE